MKKKLSLLFMKHHIQKFCRDKMNSLKDRLAKDKLRNLLQDAHKN